MTSSESQSIASSHDRPPAASGNLLGGLTATVYLLFTLLVDSNSLMVSWPWVFIWQVGWLCPVLWLLGLLWQRQTRWLGSGLDWLVGILLVGLLLSATIAPFPMQARWFSWIALCGLAALYALNAWLHSPERRSRLLTAQGYLSLIFIIISLGLWTTQTLLPELARVRSLQTLGVNLGFEFANIQLRNWIPIGHQNYVAGYLLLVLPLLLALGIQQTGWRRWLWWSGFGLGLLDLYTTSSRAGWLVGCGVAIVALAFWFRQRSNSRQGLLLAGTLGAIGLGITIFANNRFRTVLGGLARGEASGEVAFRLITIATGWHMGWSRWWAGNGGGSVPLMYQQFRPHWAGREAELVYQLHSTPAQLWAELGIWGLAVGVGTIVLFTHLTLQWLRRPTREARLSRGLIGSLLVGLSGYSLFSLTDYQLDNVCISGVLILYIAILAAEFRPLVKLDSDRQFPMSPRLLTLAGLGVLLAIGLWLAPIQRAWMLSSQAFAALSRQDLNRSVQQLTQAQQLAPWEPYYAHQLGWVLGDLGLKQSDRSQQQALLTDAIAQLQQGNQVSPHQEFGHTNLAWLLLERDPVAAGQAFARSAQLVPAKRGVFYGLGLSLLAQNKPDLAVAALTLEAARDPVLITSPVWQSPTLRSSYGQVLQQLEARFTTLLASAPPASSLATQLHQSRGALRWWVGNLAGARADLDQFGTPIAQAVLALAAEKTDAIPTLPPSAGSAALNAWLDPANRQNWLQQAWIWANRESAPAETLQPLVESMTRARSFDDWLKRTAPSRQSRRERAGFGVLSRHVDGVNPIDFLTVIENVPIADFFPDLVPSFPYAPDLDSALQPDREALLK